mmetsp:Transcript_13942/g.38070  ORF Transcript_13942/g.38070 Transcript_13942/m.38070 type:complete len:319 (+) Transcript_13942:114-1070(+)
MNPGADVSTADAHRSASSCASSSTCARVADSKAQIIDLKVDTDIEKVGIKFVSWPPGDVVVEETLVGTWAEDAGIQAGDRLVKINGQSVAEMQRSVLVTVMAGRPLYMQLLRHCVGAAETDDVHKDENEAASRLNAQLAELERLQLYFVEKWVVSSAKMIEAIGLKVIKRAQPYFDALRTRKRAQQLVEALAKRLHDESGKHQQQSVELGQCISEVEAADSWEEWDIANSAADAVRTATSHLEATLDTLDDDYRRAMKVLRKAQARVDRLEDELRPNDPSGPVWQSRPFYAALWRYEALTHKVLRKKDAVTSELRALQ